MIQKKEFFMNQRQLKYFLEVYKYRSITTAAQSLFISPQGLSKTILALEKEINTKLFTRSGKQMIPTKEAIHLSSHAKHILDEYDMIQNGEFISTPSQVTLTVPVCYDCPKYFPAEFFYEFHRIYPEILLRMEENTDSRLHEIIQENGAELAIIPGPLNIDQYKVDYLFTHRFSLLINKNHPLSKKDGITYEDLSGESLVIKGTDMPTSESQINNLLACGGELSVILEVTDIDVIESMAEQNYAIGYTLDYLAGHAACRNVTVKPLVGEASKKVMYLAQKQGHVLSHAADIFRGFLLSWLASHPELSHS